MPTSYLNKLNIIWSVFKFTPCDGHARKPSHTALGSPALELEKAWIQVPPPGLLETSQCLSEL